MCNRIMFRTYSLWIWITYTLFQTQWRHGVNSHLMSMESSLQGISCDSSHFSSKQGVYKLSGSQQRQLPIVTDDVTYETIHPSALQQLNVQPQELLQTVETNPHILASLKNLERHLHANWPTKAFAPLVHLTESSSHPPSVGTTSESEHTHSHFRSIAHGIHDVAENTLRSITHSERTRTEAGEPVYDENWIGRHASPFGSLLSR
jgi:hypothetical protein